MYSYADKIKIFTRKVFRSFYYYGFRYECPLCGYTARKFMPQGIIERKNAKCPRCRTTERTRILWLHIKKIISQKTKDKLNTLVFAPEPEFDYRLKTNESLLYTSTRYPNKDYADVVYDITNIDCDNESFDLVITSHVLEHVKDDGKAMRELFRIVKPGGVVLIMVPLWPSLRYETFEDKSITDPMDRLAIYGQSDHLRIYGMEIEKQLINTGFDVKIIDYCKDVYDSKITKYALNNTSGVKDLIFECKRPSQ
jgi:SAM-dependent methyltransferase